MIGIGLAFILATTLAAAEPPPPPVNITVTAVHATHEKRAEKFFDPGIEGLRSAVADLEFDTYKKIRRETLRAPFNRDTTLELTPKYTLAITPISKESKNQIRVKVCVQMPPRAPGARPVNALDTTLLISPGKQVKLRGLKLDPGELVIILSL